MAILDPLINGFLRFLDTMAGPVDEFFGLALAQDADEEQRREIEAELLDQLSPTDELAEVLVDAAVNNITEPLRNTGFLNPENVEGVLEDTEGNAAGLLFNTAGFGLAVETGTAGLVDQSMGEITGALAGLGIDDVTGTEIEWRLEKGIGPAMEAKVAKEHRSEFVALGDAVEFGLRNKSVDSGFLRATGAEDNVVDAIGSVDPVNANNLVEEWGIRDDNVPILEEVAIQTMEFEELIETPAELGLIIPDDILQAELDRAGYAEDLKGFLSQINDELPRSNRLWEERTSTEAAVDELETLVGSGEITPGAAVQLLPAEVDDAKPALRERFQQLADLPNKAPTRSQIDSSFAWGLTDRATLKERYARVDVDPEKYEDVIRASILDEADGQLQEAVALGLLSENDYSTLLGQAGLDNAAIGQLLQGQSIGDITEQRLQEQADPGELSVESISGIGDSRGAGLRAAGIETVGDLAQADVQTVADAAQVETQTAEDYISAAQDRVT